ncbi:hypothetical protein [Cupriavidus metallidurans]|uniref:hypothetical protein n=1 Tax=Cupriavidus metallidurans TaxID=119219 RepID=UPI003D031F98
MQRLKIAAETGTDSDDAERIALTERVRAAEAEVRRLEDEATKCRAAIDGAVDAAEVVEDLRRARAQLLADAVVGGHVAILTGIDAELATATEASDKAAQDADDARIMSSVIAERVEVVKDDLAAYRETLKSIARAELARLYDEALAEYGRCVEALREPVERLFGISEVRFALAGRSDLAINSVARMLRNEGLRIQRAHDKAWVEPAWLNADSRHGAAYRDLTEMFKGWGLKL